jgi:IS30 family transposase
MVEDRAVPGHWEGDLMFGDRNSQIATLVERQTRYVMLVKVASKDTETVSDALIDNARKLPRNSISRSLGTAVKSWLTINVLRLPPISMSTSVIRIERGNAALMKTRMG